MRNHTSNQVGGVPPIRQQSPLNWPLVSTVLTLSPGIGLMDSSLVLALQHSRTLPRATLAMVDTCYMAGFSLLLVLMVLP